MAERDLPTLVARLRLIFDDTGIKDAKRAVAALEGDLTKTAEDRKFDAFMARARRQDAERLAKQKRASNVVGADSNASAERTLTTYARTATALAGIGAAYSVVRESLTAYLDEGARGAFVGTAEQRTYEETAATLDDLSKRYDKAKVSLGQWLATNLNPTSSGFKKGLITLKEFATDPLGFSEGTKDATLARQFGGIDKRASKMIAAWKAEAVAVARAEAGRAQLLIGLSAAGKAQDYLNKAQEKSAGLSRTVETATRRVASAQDALADAHRRVADAQFDVLDAEDDLREAQFRQGVGSEEAIKAGRALDRARVNAADARAGVGEAGRALVEANLAVKDANVNLNKNIQTLNGTLERLIPKIIPGTVADTTNLLAFQGTAGPNVTINTTGDVSQIAPALNRELDWHNRGPGRRAR